MEYIFLFLLGWIVLCLPALIYAMVANGRRRRELALLDEKVTGLARALDALEHRTRVAAQPSSQPLSTPVSAQPAPAPEVKILPTPPVPKPAAPPVAAAPPMPPKPVPAPFEKPPATIAKPIAPPAVPAAPPAIPRQEMPHAQAAEVLKPVAPPPPPIAKQPAAMQASASYRAGQPAIPGMSAPPRLATPAGGPIFSAPPAAAVKAKKQSLEYSLGTNWLPKLGIVILVVGVGFLVGHAWGQFAPALRVLILYAGAVALLMGGVFLERREHFRVLGRGLIGGGWAVLALVTYAIANLRPVLVLPSKSADLFLLVGLVGAMVWHTLKYNSQLVTGAAFLLGFISIGMNPVPPYNLVAGAMVITGLTVIVLRYGWFELEIFGILASYINHFLWLYPIIEPMAGQKHQFADFWPSVALLGFYWGVFRTSYLLRKPPNKEQESVSTIAALVNPILLLAVMKYQSFHPEMAFYALLALGAVEFILGQLPAARRRVAPFYVLSSLGAAMMVASVPFKYSGHSLELLWLAGGEAFLLAGIFTRERLFRGFGIIVSLLVAFYTMPVRMPALLQEIVNREPHYHAQLSLVLAIIALVLYANSHLTRRFWPDLFRDDLEQGTLPIFSFIASVFTVAGAYAFFTDKTVPIVLALIVTVLSVLGKSALLAELMYEGYWIALLVMIQTTVSVRTLETSWHGISERILIVAPIAALLYLSSRFVRLSVASVKEIATPAYAVFGSTLLALLMWFQAPVWAVTLWWIGLALALSVAGQTLKRVDLKWQAFVLMLLAFSRSLAVNLDLTATYHHLTYRLITVSLAAVGIYLLARWAPLNYIRPAYTVAGTFLLALVAADEAPEPWVAVAWVALALVLVLAARLWKDRALLWQTHVLGALAAGWTFYANFAAQYRGTRVQLETVGITVALLYTLVWLTDIDRLIEDERICQGYAWAASLLLSWLAWFQLHPENVSLAWGILGLALFEIPEIFSLAGVDLRRFAASWKAQAYVALAGSFVHIFYGNFNTRTAGNLLQVTLDPRVLTVVMLVPIYFYIYVRAHAETPEGGSGRASAATRPLRISAEYLVASLGTATVASLVRFEVDPEAVVVGYAAIVVLLLIVAWRTWQQLFIYQALVMLGVTAFRISMYNFYHLHEAFSFSPAGAGWAIGLLAFAVPVAMLARKTIPESTRPGWIHTLVRHPEQPVFFVPVLLLGVLLYLKMPGGMITLSWGLEGVLVFLLALWARERSFRLAGLGLLLLCVGKILFYDAWQLSDPTARYMTLIGVGAILLVVSYLYGKNREALREYL